MSAARYTLYHEIEVEDHGYAVVRYNNGAVGGITVSTACVGMNNERLEISGTRGSISATFNEIVDLNIPDVQLPPCNMTSLGNKPLFQELLVDFMHAVETGAVPMISGSAATQATELVNEIYRIADRK